MILTEEEAKKKWCPMFRFMTDHGTYMTNRQPGFFDEPFCIASACMVWQWIDRLAGKVDTGYCGL